MEQKRIKINIHSMRFRVFLYGITLAIIPVLIISYVIYQTSYGVIKNQTDNSERLLLNQVCSNISGNLDKVELSAGAVVSNVDILRSLRTYQYMDVDTLELNTRSQAALKSYTIIGDIISSIYIKTYQGKEMYFGLTYSADQEREWFLPLIQKYGDGKPRWIYQHSHTEDEPDRLNYVVPFNDYYKGGAKMGCMVISVKTEMFSQIFGKINQIERGDYFVVDEASSLIYGKNDIYEKLKAEDYDFEEGEFEVVELDGVKSVLSYGSVDGTDWKVISKVPVKEYLSGLTAIQNTLFISFLVSIMSAIYMTVLFSKKFMQPINSLLSEMEQIEKGNFEPQAHIYREDEIGYLKERFDEMVMRIRELMERICEKEKEKRTAELNALQSQIHPHFLYNTLNSVYCLAQINRQVKIAAIISNLSEMLRMSVGYQEEFVTLKNEIDYIKKYVEISNIRWGGRFQLECRCPESLLNYQMPKLILQPLVENSINHGFINFEESGHIDLSAEQEGDNLVIRIKDDGIGIEEQRMAEINDILRDAHSKADASIGIYNVNSRLKLHFGEEYGLQFEKREAYGVCAILLLPKREGEK